MIAQPHEDDKFERGAAAVEFALVLPILIVLVFGMIEFGQAFNTQISLSGAAREGVRVMAIENDPAAAQAATVAAAPSVSPTPAVSVTPADCDAGGEATVIASTDLTYDIPFFGTATIPLEGRGVMRCGG